MPLRNELGATHELCLEASQGLSLLLISISNFPASGLIRLSGQHVMELGHSKPIVLFKGQHQEASAFLCKVSKSFVSS